jgi:hypothetical protein
MTTAERQKALLRRKIARLESCSLCAQELAALQLLKERLALFEDMFPENTLASDRK